MAGTKFAVMMIWVSLIWSCKTTEASSQSKSVASVGYKSGAVVKSGVQGKTEGVKVESGSKTEDDKSPVVLQWIFGRYSTSSVEEIPEVRDQPGFVKCSITEKQVERTLAAGELVKLRDAIKALLPFKESTRRNLYFRAVIPSRELIAYVDGQEFLVELSFQAQVVLTPPSPDIASSFANNLSVVMNVANELKLCPSLNN